MLQYIGIEKSVEAVGGERDLAAVKIERVRTLQATRRLGYCVRVEIDSDNGCSFARSDEGLTKTAGTAAEVQDTP
jgi:hypothetical protein